MSLKNFLQFLWAGKNLLKNHNNLMHYYDVILLSDVIWAFGPKVTRRVTYSELVLWKRLKWKSVPYNQNFLISGFLISRPICKLLKWSNHSNMLCTSLAVALVVCFLCQEHVKGHRPHHVAVGSYCPCHEKSSYLGSYLPLGLMAWIHW